MGQKTNPIGFRLAVRRNWQSRWYATKKDFSKLLLEDQIIREKLMEKLKQASVPRIFIERASNRVRVKIYTARPGIVIGRKGQEIEKIKEELAKLTGKEILLDIQEVKKPEIEAQLVAENVGQHREAVAFEDQSHGDAGCQRLERGAGVEQRQAGTAYRSHGGGAVGFGHL